MLKLVYLYITQKLYIRINIQNRKSYKTKILLNTNVNFNYYLKI